MNFKNKGQTIFSNILIASIVLFVIAVGVVAATNWSCPSSISSSFETVSEIVIDILGPFFGFLLNLESTADMNVKFLIVLAFIMISIIIIGTLDSMNLFGKENKGNLINFVVGIVTSIIGVRFMPPEMWKSLTTPSSAFVATLIVGIPFLALGFVSMKIKFSLARKAVWLFYLVVLGYLIAINDEILIYVIFAVLAGIMFFFDASVRRYFYTEKSKLEIETMIGKLTLKERKTIRDEIRAYQEIVADVNAPLKDKVDAKAILIDLEKQYGDINRI